jgi:hypothetical protein
VAERVLKVILDIVPKANNAFQKALGIGAGGASKIPPLAQAAQQKDTSKYLGQITDKFSSMTKEIAKLNVAIRPELVEKQANLEIKLAKARADQEKAVAKAIDRQKREQTFGAGRFGAVLSHLPGAATGAGVAGKLGLNKQFGGSVGAVLGVAGLTIGAVVAATTAVVGAGFGAVGSRSPETMERFERVFSDATAIVGDAFVPLMEVATDEMRFFADVLATITPTAQEVRDGLAPLRSSLSELHESVMPLIPLMTATVKFAVEHLVNQLKFTADALGWFVSRIGGYNLPGVVPLKSSVGAAATGAHYTSGEQIARTAYAAAFASGASRTAAEKTAEATEKTAEQTSSIADTLLDILVLMSPAGGNRIVANAIRGH